MKKKIIVISLLCSFFIILVSVITILVPVEIDNTGYTLIKNLKIPVYSKVKVKDLIISIEGKVITNKTLNTERLGKQEVSFLYQNKDNEEKKGLFTIEVVDDEKPLVWLSGSYNVRVGSDIKLEKEILCADNYDNNPNCKIEGDYDLNTVGTYNLTYIATDSSNNEERIAFILNVYEPTNVSTTQIQDQTTQREEIVTAFNDVVTTYKNKNTEIGIDVSKWQGNIDFKKVKEAAATFVMIRVGSQQGVDGEYVLDPYFKKNIENALANDLKVGVYFYSYANSKKEARKQAKWVLNQIKDYEITLPIAFDWECYNSFNQMELSLFGLNEVAESFLDEVENKKYDGMLYGSKNYLNDIWKYHEYDVWLAHYTDKTDYDSHYVMWQLCQDGKIDGINTLVDINVLYKNNTK